MENNLVCYQHLEKKKNTMESSDTTKLTKIKITEEDLSKVVELYGNNLVLFINGYVKDINAAEDLMEDTFMELIIHKHAFRGESTLKTYLFKIARNKALNHIKRNRKLVDIPNELEDEKQLEEIIMKNETNKLVNKALKQLNSDYATVLYLIYFENLSYNEVSKIMKKTNKQVKNLAYRARNSLKEVLKEEGILPKEGLYYEE